MRGRSRLGLMLESRRLSGHMSGPVTKIGSPGARPLYPAPLAILADMKDEVIATVRSSVPPGENWSDLR